MTYDQAIMLGIVIYVFIGMVVFGISIAAEMFPDDSVDLLIFILAVIFWPVAFGFLIAIPFKRGKGDDEAESAAATISHEPGDRKDREGHGGGEE
jgi:hypothetical protein